ncbi:MAG TPA: hypothetical protein VHM90_07075 [Phycisphaerae bacterium]|nr:hypothetical protein [Phycisphaerae bacterium]
MQVKITVEKVRTVLKVIASWEHPQDGIHPSRTCTVYANFHTNDELEAWANGLVAGLGVAYIEDVRLSIRRDLAAAASI